MVEPWKSTPDSENFWANPANRPACVTCPGKPLEGSQSDSRPIKPLGYVRPWQELRNGRTHAWMLQLSISNQERRNHFVHVLRHLVQVLQISLQEFNFLWIDPEKVFGIDVIEHDVIVFVL